mmetsp:Transcript_43142/g.52327  ORF Transcript_43142/g.52327 Transcript_43142/m.52327 type:complete len:605 (+) Transcript_43142:399-2213(+)|eukprot:CAMPEP_0172488722 /NCGR_PEP_ID=MMETSP1066-20121228/18413_1 /TAXON_ID=671091 /ORGANISM="Coscinodiscus wailesii, Strain CCMP2513" /LENGTH=604 /DNA_ID=CAMNT_0013256133 /DNA_START=230 /DNA_END=2044 /DNA_ORIENTATION=-
MYDATTPVDLPPGSIPPGAIDDDDNDHLSEMDSHPADPHHGTRAGHRGLDVSRLDGADGDTIQDIGLDDDLPNGASGAGGKGMAVVKQTAEGEFRGDFRDIDVPIRKSVYIFAACAALNSANLGYDIGVNTDAAKFVQDSLGLSDVQLEIFMGSLNLFAMVGALCAHFVTDKAGRRRSFVVASFLFIVGVGIMASAGGYGMLMFGRVFVGLGVGFGLAIDPIYIAEIAPATHRGKLVTWSEIATNIGIVMGFMSGLIFSNLSPDLAWRYMFGMGGIMPVILIFLACGVMPESPRWLVQNGREVEAIRVLENIYPPGFDIEAVVRDIRESIEKEIEAEHAVGWDVILFPTPAFRRMLICGIGIAIAQQAVGIDAIQYFLIFIIDESGIKSRGAQVTVLIVLGIIKLIFILIAAPLLDKLGRRPLFFVSLSGCSIALFMVSFDFFTETHNAGFAIFALALYLASFSLGMGPAAWLIPAEVFPTSIRAKAMSVATFLNRVTATLMASTFLSTAHAMSWAGFFLLMSFVCLLVLMFVWAYLPETKGRSLEDMSLYFAELTGDRSILALEESLATRAGQVDVGAREMEDVHEYYGEDEPEGVHASGTMA